MQEGFPVPLAAEVLRVIYELQFVGRRLAVPDAHPSGEIGLKPAEDGRLVRFHSVPILVVLAEFFTPEKQSINKYQDLRTAVNYLEQRALIEQIILEEAEACTIPGFPRAVETSISSYYRPDGVEVTGWSDPFIQVSQIPAELVCGSRERIEPLSYDGYVCATGIRVGNDPVFWRFNRTRSNGYSTEPDAPAFVLGYPADFSGFPRSMNLQVTESGIASVECKRGAAVQAKGARPRGRPTDTDPATDSKWASAWRSGRYKTYAECARELDVDKHEFKRGLDRDRKRRKPAD